MEPLYSAPINKHVIPFGKILLNLRQLVKFRKLLVCYPSGGPVKQFGKARAISDEFKELLESILTTKTIDPVLQKRLATDEQHLLTSLMKVSRLGAMLRFEPYVPSTEEHLARYDVLRGALNAGLTHAPELLAELRQLTGLFTSIGRIQKEDSVWINQLLNDLETN